MNLIIFFNIYNYKLILVHLICLKTAVRLKILYDFVNRLKFFLESHILGTEYLV